jgi:hypothetical protein
MQSRKLCWLYMFHFNYEIKDGSWNQCHMHIDRLISLSSILVVCARSPPGRPPPSHTGRRPAAVPPPSAARRASLDGPPTGRPTAAPPLLVAMLRLPAQSLAGVTRRTPVAILARLRDGLRGRGQEAALRDHSWCSAQRLGRCRTPGDMAGICVSLCRDTPARSIRVRPVLLRPRRRRTRNGRKARLVAWEGTRVGFHLRR